MIMLRRSLSALLLALTLLATPDRASAALPNYKLMPGDRIAVTIFGQEQMSGRYLVDNSGQIEIPVVGPISIGSLSLDECKKMIEAELKKGILINPAVTVSVEEYRPVYVHGYVKSPGVYPFRPNMSALGAMVVAGGAPRYEATAALASTEVINAEERVNVLAAKRQKLMVHYAGLEMQRTDREAIDSSLLPSGIAGSPQFEQILASEQRRMVADIAGLKSEIEVLQRQKPLLQAEHQAIVGQIAAQTKQLDIMRQRVMDVDPLVKKGLGRTQSLLDLNMQVSILEGTVARLQATKTRNELEQSATELKIQEKLNSYKQKLLLQQADIQYEISSTETQLNAAKKMLEIRRQTLGDGSSRQIFNSFLIHRVSDGQQQVIEATALTPVEPGDIIEVLFLANAKEIVSGPSEKPAAPARQPSSPPPMAAAQDEATRAAALRKELEGPAPANGEMRQGEARQPLKEKDAKRNVTTRKVAEPRQAEKTPRANETLVERPGTAP